MALWSAILLRRLRFCLKLHFVDSSSQNPLGASSPTVPSAINTRKVHQVPFSLNVSKPLGSNGFPHTVLKLVFQLARCVISSRFLSWSWNLSIFLEGHTLGHSDPSGPKSYRLKILSSVFSRDFEVVIFDQLNLFLEREGLFRDDPLVSFSNSWSAAVDDVRETYLFSLEISMTFDWV